MSSINITPPPRSSSRHSGSNDPRPGSAGSNRGRAALPVPPLDMRRVELGDPIPSISPRMPWDVEPRIPNPWRRQGAVMTTPLPVARNLLESFEDAAVLFGELSPRSAVTISPRSNRSSDSGVTQYVHARHDEALSEAWVRFPQAIADMADTIETIYERRSQPASGQGGYCTPLWRGSVVALTDNFIDRFMAITLVRALLKGNDRTASVTQIFDCLDEVENADTIVDLLVDVRQRAAALAEEYGVECVADVIERGLSTRQWCSLGEMRELGVQAAKDLGTDCLSCIAALPAITANAVNRAAIDLFNARHDSDSDASASG